jgi:hypothetical protein
MKTRNLLIIGLLIVANSVFAGKDPLVPEVVVIGIGEKNPDFDEAKFPNITFYYTPGLVVQAKPDSKGSKAVMALAGSAVVDVYEGTPAFLVDVINEHELTGNFFVFDKSGHCYSHGFDIGRSGNYINAVGVDGASLEDTFKDLIKKEKVTKPAKKEMKLKKSDYMMGRQFSEFNVTDISGNEVAIKSITENGKPVVIIFMQIPIDAKIGEAKTYDEETTNKEMAKAKSGRDFAKSMIKGMSATDYYEVPRRIESDFFNNEIVN